MNNVTVPTVAAELKELQKAVFDLRYRVSELEAKATVAPALKRTYFHE